MKNLIQIFIVSFLCGQLVFEYYFVDFEINQKHKLIVGTRSGAPGVYDPLETVPYCKYSITRLHFEPRTSICLKPSLVLVIEVVFLRWVG